MYREPYQFNLERYIDPERFAGIREFSRKLPTPSLIVDLDLIAKKFDELSSNFPIADIYYA
ncbi:MAG: type III PLP-dependent enzyme, partial [Candidatus Cloacimonetes bacterium]|nr:type III PLP-dependent enzyme [Candidatus Cloacimonadota bacterium]